MNLNETKNEEAEVMAVVRSVASQELKDWQESERAARRAGRVAWLNAPKPKRSFLSRLLKGWS